MIKTIVDQSHHQIVIGNTEVMETAKTGAGIHDEVHQYPAGRIQNLVQREIGGISLVYGSHQLLGNAREALVTAIVIKYDTCSTACIRINDIAIFIINTNKSRKLGLMVIKGNSDARIKRQVCSDICRTNIDLAILDIFWMNKFDLINQIKFFEDHCTDKTIKVTAGYKSSFYRIFHG